MPHTLNAGSQRPRLLLVDDNPAVLQSLQALLIRPDYDVTCVGSGLEAVAALADGQFDVLVLDMALPDITGLEVMDYINAQQLGVEVVVNSGTEDIDVAIDALKRGAHSFLRKSGPRAEFLHTIDNALRARRLKQDNQRFRHHLENSERIYRHLIDSSPDLIFTLDDQGRLSFVNDRVLPLLGWHKDDLLGQPYSKLVHPDDLERAHYVFQSGGEPGRVRRNVELHLISHDLDAPARLFSHDVMPVRLPGAGRADSSTESEQQSWRLYVVAQDMTEQRRADALLQHQAYHDVLTLLPNRALFKDQLELALIQARKSQGKLAVLLIDLDRFKLINEAKGHDVGDEVLRHVAARLQSCLRAPETLSRLGDDEFTILLPELQSPEVATDMARACLNALHTPFLIEAESLRITASMGIALYPQHGQSAHELLKSADMAMYHQKSNGRDGFAVFNDGLLGAANRIFLLERDLHSALERGELEVYYQPQVDAHTGRITGAEALMRWNHPERGLLGAGEFLPYAEESGHILAMTDWLMEQSCRDLKAWNATSAQRLRLSINVSPQYLDRGDFFDTFSATLHRHGVDATQFEVEVTENICIRNPARTLAQLSQLSELGVRIAIDDFGTGYSSLSYLHRFPLHTLKIDRAFVMDIVDEDATLPVVRAIISIAKGLNLHLVAEGVETAVQQRYLAQAGCHTIQGFYYFRPLRQSQLLALLAAPG
ncbi:MAG: hypothetical protein Fur007_09770 [Rhodoferax sp.]